MTLLPRPVATCYLDLWTPIKARIETGGKERNGRQHKIHNLGRWEHTWGKTVFFLEQRYLWATWIFGGGPLKYIIQRSHMTDHRFYCVLWICALAKTDRLVKLTDPWSMSSVNNTNQKRPHPLDIVSPSPGCEYLMLSTNVHHHWLSFSLLTEASVAQLDWCDVCAVIRSMMRAATKLVKANKVLDAAVFGDFSSDIGDNIGSNFVLKTNFLWPN